jgi:transcriptional regulator with XRE-family HTH domain
MPDRRRRRAGAARAAGRRRSGYLATRIGIGLREARQALRVTQAQAADRAGVSQGFWSQLERGSAGSVSLETLAACAESVETQLAAFLEARPGADLPRDIAHLRGQELILRTARPGGWAARVEHGIDRAARRSRSVDVLLERVETKEIVVIELIDLLVDGGEAMRGLADKVIAVRRREPRAKVAGLLVVRATQRNRAVVRELGGVFRARFPAPSDDWLVALTHRQPMPEADGFLWAAIDGSVLRIARLRS